MQKDDSKLLAEFYWRAVVDDEATKAAGRAIHKQAAYVRIDVPGDKTSTIDRPVRDEDKQRFPRQWAAFEVDAEQAAASGTLLSAWGALSPALVADYRYLKVLTVEQLAGMSDSNVKSLGSEGQKHREMARAFLEASKSNAPLLALQAQLDARDAEVAALRQALKEQGDKVEALAAGREIPVAPVRSVPKVEAAPVPADKPAPKKRGRPAKAVQA